MDFAAIYPVVLSLVLIGMVLGIGIVILGTLQTNSAVTAISTNPNLTSGPVWAINQTIIAMGSFATWLGIIVLVIAAAIVISLVLNSFKQG